MVLFLILYVDDILLIENDVGNLSSVKVWLSAQFDMKDLGEASHILGTIKNFCLNYSLSKGSYSLAELKELQAAEGIIGH